MSARVIGVIVSCVCACESISLTCTAAAIGRELKAGFTGTVEAAQGVDAALLAKPIIRPGAFIDLWSGIET